MRRRVVVYAALLLFLGLFLAPLSESRAESSVPGFPGVQWGMNQAAFLSAVEGRAGEWNTSKRDNGDGTWIGAITNGAIEFAGYRFKGAAFYFDQESGGLVAYSTSFTMAQVADLLKIADTFEKQFQPVSPSRRAERESVHFTYTDGTSYIHLVQFKSQRNDKFLTVRVTRD